MYDPKDILALLGISWDEISKFEVYPDEESCLVNAEMVDKRPCCPSCGSPHTVIKGYYVRTINDSIIKQKKLIVQIRQRRYVCKKCGKSFKQKLSFIQTGANISIATKSSIVEDLKKVRTLASIAEEHNVSTTTVLRILDSLPFFYHVHLPPALCIDEFHFINRKSLGKFPAVISDYFNGNIIDIIPSRKTSYLVEYFEKFRQSELNNVRYFISDMNDIYKTIKHRYFKNATHIIDMFHITKLFTGAITSIRTRIMKSEEYKSKEYNFLKKNWKLFLMHQDKLRSMRKVNERTGIVSDLSLEVTRVLKMYPDLNAAYQIYEEFYYRTKRLLTWYEADSLMTFLIRNLDHSLIPELNSAGKSLQKWKYEITNTISKNIYNSRLSNAVAESNNNGIQTLIDVCYGLTNFERLRKRVLLIAAHKKTRDF